MAGVSSGSKANGSTSNNDKSKSDQSASKATPFMAASTTAAALEFQTSDPLCDQSQTPSLESTWAPFRRSGAASMHVILLRIEGFGLNIADCPGINQNIKKGGKCWSYTFMVDSTDAKSTNGHCYGNFAPMWDPVEYKKPGVKVLSGRHYSWTPYSVAVANFISLDKAISRPFLPFEFQASDSSNNQESSSSKSNVLTVSSVPVSDVFREPFVLTFCHRTSKDLSDSSGLISERRRSEEHRALGMGEASECCFLD
eukprot:751917-Hanusia_phi.AAC.3